MDFQVAPLIKLCLCEQKTPVSDYAIFSEVRERTCRCQGSSSMRIEIARFTRSPARLVLIDNDTSIGDGVGEIRPFFSSKSDLPKV